MPLLEVRGLTKYFGGLAAVLDVDLDVNRGEIIGLIGPNGAGKTTFFNLVTGFIRPTRGKIYFKGQDITGISPHTIARMGIVRTFQQTLLFKERTTIENVLIGHFLQDKAGYLSTFLNTPYAQKGHKDSLEKSMEIVEFMGLSHVKNELIKNLPYGYQRVLGVCIALASDPELLLLDEPVTGMNAEEIANMTRSINRIRSKGFSIIVVEHNMRAVMSLSDKIVVLNYGRKIAEGLPEEIRKNPVVVEAYLGTSRAQGDKRHVT